MPLSGTSIAFELRFNPIDRRPIAISALKAVAELCQSFDRCLISLEVEPSDQHRDRIVGGHKLTGNQRWLLFC